MAQEIISHFKDKPNTPTTWWTLGLGLSLLFLPFLLKYLPNYRLGAINLVPFILLPIMMATLTTCIISYKKGERSYVLLIGFIPVLLFVLVLIAEFTFME